MAGFTRKRLPHEIPEWIDPSLEVYFITVNCKPRHQNQLAHPDVWEHLMESIHVRENRGHWHWELFLAMPDHIHGIVTFPSTHDIAKTISAWKRWHANQHSISWQKGFFEHRLRTWESAQEKSHYILMNPVRAGLVDKILDWSYVQNQGRFCR